MSKKEGSLEVVCATGGAKFTGARLIPTLLNELFEAKKSPEMSNGENNELSGGCTGGGVGCFRLPPHIK